MSIRLQNRIFAVELGTVFSMADIAKPPIFLVGWGTFWVVFEVRVVKGGKAYTMEIPIHLQRISISRS
jgi:hypothetical protein